MAIPSIVLTIFVTFCVLHLQVHGQNEDCVPQAVHNITISSNATLWWEVDPNEPCEITNFKLDIEGDGEAEYHFNVTENFKDLSFLEICELWEFTVTPVSHETVGYDSRLTAHIPLPPDADLSLSYFRVTLNGSTVFDWDLSNKTYGECTLEYRLTMEDLDRGTIQDVYVEGKSALLTDAVPCVSYQIAIRAVNVAHPIIEGPSMRMNYRLGARPQKAPTLKSVVSSFTSFNVTWALEGDNNRCPLRSIHVDGGDYFNFSVPLQNLQDSTQVTTEVTSLKPNSMYHFKVIVENSGGRSAPAHVAVQTLPLAGDS